MVEHRVEINCRCWIYWHSKCGQVDFVSSFEVRFFSVSVVWFKSPPALFWAFYHSFSLSACWYCYTLLHVDFGSHYCDLHCCGQVCMCMCMCASYSSKTSSPQTSLIITKSQPNALFVFNLHMRVSAHYFCICICILHPTAMPSPK